MLQTTPVDASYIRTRETLLPYEDARFNSLLSGVPNCYPAINDSSVWGSLLRAIAQELARIDYGYAYDLVSYNPTYLTPPDIKRRWAGPLFINSSYPTASEFDIDYKQMLVALLAAYPQGTTVATITAVIAAYTGQQITVQELYKQIGNGIYDDSDRNTIKVSLNASNVGDPFTAALSATRLAVLSQDLSAAIDLAKPAHVGLSYSISFGSAENFTSLLAGITDYLELLYDATEGSGVPPIFTDAPLLSPASPITELAAAGKRAGAFLALHISAAQYAALLSNDYRAEYVANADGTYSLNPAAYNDMLLLDMNGNPTGVVSRAEGVLAPELDTSIQIKSDTLRIYRLD